MLNVLQLSRLLSLRAELARHSQWSREQLERHQAESLAWLRNYAYSHSRFYKAFHAGMEASPLHQLPVLTKATLMEHWDEIVTDRSLRLARVQEFVAGLKRDDPVKLFNGRYYVASTAGSSGLKGIFVYDDQEWLTVLASYVRANDWAGVEVGLARRLRVAVVSTTSPWHQSALVSASLTSWFVPSLRVDSTEPMDVIVRQLNDFQPRSLIAYANMARLLAEEQIAGALHISPEAVFCASEVLTPDSRRLIKEAWGAEPFNIYAATESAGIASECSEHHDLHLYEDLVIVEVVDGRNEPVPPGEYGERVLVSVLFSRTLPLIRYEVSDSVRLSTMSCTCHCPFASISDVQGRTEDIVYLPAGSGARVAVQPNIFHDIMEKLPVGGWQVVQEQEDLLRVLVMNAGTGYKESELIGALSGELGRLGAGATRVKVEHVTSLRQGALGKTRLISALK